MIRWGIYGLGKIAHKIANDLKYVDGSVLHSVCSTDLGRAEAFSKKYKAQGCYDSLEAFLADADLDVVYIGAEHTRHYSTTMAAINAGKAVLCEKPFAMNLAEVNQMIDAAKAKNVFLMEALWSRFLPSFEQAIAWVHRGKIGTIKAIHADFGYKADTDPNKRLFNKDMGGGALLDIGIYPIFLSYLFLGMPSDIKATTIKDVGGIDVSTTISFRYTADAVAVLACNFATDTRTEGIVYGTEGHISLHPKFHMASGLTLNTEDRESRSKEWPRPDTYGYEYELTHVADCLRKGLKESPTWTFKDAQNLMKLLDAVRKEIDLVY
jgi:predicted dehydrogenase